MAIQSDPLARNIDFFRNLGTSFLSGSGVFAAWQFDSLQAAITRSSQLLKTTWSDASAAQEPAQWPETAQNAMRNAIKINRDYLIGSADYQMETMRLLQEMGAEIQQVVTEALNEQLVTIDMLGAREKRKSSALAAQKLAA